MFLSILLLLTAKIQADQTDSTDRKFKYNQTISFSVVGPVNYYSLNHSKIVKEYKRSAIIHQISLSYYHYTDFNIDYGNHYQKKNYLISFLLIKQFGIHNHHFLIGLGSSVVHRASKHESFYYSNVAREEENYTKGYPFGILGYSYRNPSKRFYLSISIYPVYDYGKFSLIPMPRLTIGYNYRKPEIHLVKSNLSERLSGFTVGYETNIGYSVINSNAFGTSKGLSWNNFLSIVYYPTRMYIKVVAGNSIFYNNNFEKKSEGPDPQNPAINQRFSFSPGFSSKLFDQPPVFWSFGGGVGYLLINKKNWQCTIETITGTFFNKRMRLKPQPDLPDINLTNNIDYSLNFKINQKWFASAGISVHKHFSEYLNLSMGIIYKRSDIEPGCYRLKVNDYLCSIGIGYKIR